MSKFFLALLHLPDLKANLALWQKAGRRMTAGTRCTGTTTTSRIVSRFGDDSDEFRVTSAKTLGTVLHMLRGTPYVYQGEELGMTNAGYTEAEQYADIESVNFTGWRRLPGCRSKRCSPGWRPRVDNARTPVQWTEGPNAGHRQDVRGCP